MKASSRAQAKGRGQQQAGSSLSRVKNPTANKKASALKFKAKVHQGFCFSCSEKVSFEVD